MQESFTQPRISIDEQMMGNAKITALRGTCLRASVGAVIVRGGHIISQGYVGSLPGQPHCNDVIDESFGKNARFVEYVGCDLNTDGRCIRTVHAEANALLWAARNGYSIDGATMYCTHLACVTCARMLIQAGIREFVWEKEYSSDMAVEDKIALLEESGVTCRQLQSLSLQVVRSDGISWTASVTQTPSL